MYGTTGDSGCCSYLIRHELLLIVSHLSGGRRYVIVIVCA